MCACVCVHVCNVHATVQVRVRVCKVHQMHTNVGARIRDWKKDCTCMRRKFIVSCSFTPDVHFAHHRLSLKCKSFASQQDV